MKMMAARKFTMTWGVFFFFLSLKAHSIQPSSFSSLLLKSWQYNMEYTCKFDLNLEKKSLKSIVITKSVRRPLVYRRKHITRRSKMNKEIITNVRRNKSNCPKYKGLFEK